MEMDQTLKDVIQGSAQSTACFKLNKLPGYFGNACPQLIEVACYRRSSGFQSQTIGSPQEGTQLIPSLPIFATRLSARLHLRPTPIAPIACI
jgi:hypothetical protein